MRSSSETAFRKGNRFEIVLSATDSFKENVLVEKKFCFLFFVLCAPRVFSLSFNDEGSPKELAAQIVNQMSDEEVLAQTFMLGWVGLEPSPLILDWIRQRNLGGVKIFGWNTSDTLKLAETVGTFQKEALKGRFNIPLLVATDQEGGWIRHVKGSTSETPGNMAIGASGYPQDAYWSGFYIGRELAALGINMNFAPTVDLYTNRDSTLIGPRSFGVDPANTGIFGLAFMRGQEATGVIPTAKHFPGHGDTDLDSHGILPQIGASFDVLWDRELVPYRMLSLGGLPAVMSGHLAFPNTESGMTPASLSPWFLQDVLREKIGFQGVVITDDLMMNGATMSAGSLSKAAKQAIAAGNDIIMFSKTPLLLDPVWTVLLDAVKKEPPFKERVRDAARRILETKLKYLRGEKAVPFIPDVENVKKNLPDPEGAAFFLGLAARSVTVVKDDDFPLSPSGAGKVLLTGQYLDFFKQGRIAYPGAKSYWYAPDFGIADFLRYAREADTIIFCLSDELGMRFLQSLQTLKKKVIVLSVLSPVYLDGASWVDGAIAVYSYANESFIAGFSVLLGKIEPHGRLPFPLLQPRWTAPPQ
ncbi:MAG: glycoside hydrolase family 3 protein [Treponema sp.]|jgi:beta-N-acetylhexosaminidase|nr:glycoside hydrolase family 3 protein [Treponema sp.]